MKYINTFIAKAPSKHSLLILGFLLLLLPEIQYITENLSAPSISPWFLIRYSLELASNVCLISGILYLLMLRIFNLRNISFGHIVLSIAFTIYLFSLIGGYIFEYSGLVKASLVGIILGIVFLLLFINKFSKMLFIWMIVVISLILFQFSTQLYYAMSINYEKHSPLIPILHNESDIQQKRNIYYVILDTYSSPEYMKSYGYQNPEFIISSMEKMGYFYAKDARSSYNRTYYTFRSIFDVDYFSDRLDHRSMQYDVFPRMLSKPTIPYLITYLKEHGYKFYWSGNQIIPCFSSEYSICLNKNSQSVSNYNLWNFVNTNWILTEYNKYREQIVSYFKPKINDKRESLFPIIDWIDSNFIPPSPAFVLIHDMTAHPPYQYLSDCKANRMGPPPDATAEEASNPKWRGAYLESIYCANKQMLQLAHYLQDNDPNSIVIIQGDHGPHFESSNISPIEITPKSVEERTRIINFLKLPSHCQSLLRENIGTVNSIRLALGCALGKHPHLVKEKSFFVDYYDSSSPDFGKITLVWKADKKESLIHPFASSG